MFALAGLPVIMSRSFIYRPSPPVASLFTARLNFHYTHSLFSLRTCLSLHRTPVTLSWIQ
ncbi:hypothetical protein SNOG_20051 [Parastagonospora nodorum SN15]|uniref:Uncharacterized protein n=1 Tax=Phaeosphaeria nodorum (strain SN15 / ATCC MYA-4574 / FGSC 10173) TaxID=321614 RepID=A9JX45_PHANO|nr:hypothetical protein SNOG_20051 [Parastagonospora nodorum SN15]EDP89907.1 hypothetical protein SNOG_20051 [Parastagonospora nodorum SN15]